MGKSANKHDVRYLNNNGIQEVRRAAAGIAFVEDESPSVIPNASEQLIFAVRFDQNGRFSDGHRRKPLTEWGAL